MYHLSPCIVALPDKRVQSDAAAAAGYRGENQLCKALRIEAAFGKVAAWLTRRALGGEGRGSGVAWTSHSQVR